MRISTALAITAATLVALTVPLTAAADVTIGANVGSARINSGDFDGDDTGWKLHVGTSFNDVIGAELGYVNFGQYALDGAGTAEDDNAQAWTAAVTLGVPMGVANLYAKAGAAATEVEGNTVREESSDTDQMYGVGVRFGRDKGLGFRAEYERYQFEEFDLDMAQLGVELRF